MSERGVIVLAAGGTGGHVFPAVALAETLAARGWRPVFATDDRGLRYNIGFETHRIQTAGLAGGFAKKLAGALAILRGTWQAVRLLRRTRAAAVVGFGGFPSLPAMLAAVLLRRPILLHEQNAVLGRVNRLLASKAKVVGLSFAETKGAPGGASRLVGNPVRAAVRDVGDGGYTPPGAGERDPINVLIFGGSQGARVLSDALPAAVAGLEEDLRRRIAVTQQCRPEDLDRVSAVYAEADVRACLAPFFEDMPARLARTHLVVARAGASTVAELAAAGRPSILVPFAGAMDDHQTANAEALVAAGAGWRVAEADATSERLGALLADKLSAPIGLGLAAAAARSVANADAAAVLADLVEGAAQGRAPASATALRGLAA